MLAAMAGAAAGPVKPVGLAAAPGVSTRLATEYQTVSSDFVRIEPGPDELSALAQCPAGTLPISGGPNISSDDVVLVSSFPNGNSWQVTLRNDGSTDATFFSFAVCATEIPGYEVLSANATHVPPGGVGSSRRPCPAGKMAIGGGPFVSGASHKASVTSTSTFLRLEWAAEIRNDGDTSMDLVAYAVCVPDSPAYQIISTDWINIAGSEIRYIHLLCPEGMIAASAGVFVRDERVVISNFSPITEREWHLTLKNVTTTADQYHTSITCTT
ncbi:hypothetical protein Rhe02_36790 [Rhizocola hellebori]|uniref:Uncharacterized protein n=1 Tax=Rhizocola hellebori TaxID=1392758 RepID=A0A8J3Q949_9ACTN|nr:hypothetical protein Rhe02_36790 [Rhizocola hellebori]